MAASPLNAWRYIPGRGGDPHWNLAADEVLLRLAGERPCLRLYRWQRPCLSIGYFQAREGCPEGSAIVRRMTGGGAIRHGTDVTYAVAGPIAAFGQGPRAAYRKIHAALQRGLARLGVVARERGKGRDEGPSGPTMCFARKGCYDLVVGEKKLVGSAQRRTGPVFLQHGSLPLVPTEAAPLCLEEALGRAISEEEVFTALEAGFEEEFGRFDVRDLDDAERASVEALVADKYATRGWNWRR